MNRPLFLIVSGLVGFLGSLGSAAGQLNWVTYDAALGTLPQDQCWPFTLDTYPPAVPEMGIGGGALHLSTTMFAATSTTGGAVYWLRQDVPIDFGTPGGAVVEARLRVVNSDYLTTPTGNPRPGYAVTITDRTGHVFWIGLGDSRIFLSNDFYGQFNTPGTVEAVFDTTDTFHTYRLEASTAGATLLVDGAPILSLSGTGPNFGASPNGNIYFGDVTYWANSETYTSFVRVSGTVPCCDSIGPIASAGDDQSVQEGVLVTLDGSASRIPCGPAGYAWIQLAGTPVTLDLTNPARPTFTAPPVLVGAERMTFQLIALDGQRASEPDTVDVTVTNADHPPVALAYDASLGTLPQDQCWPFILDTYPPAVPEVGIVGGALHLSTRMFEATGATGGAVYWLRQDIPIDFGAPGGAVAEALVRVVHSDYGIATGSGWPRPGYTVTLTDRAGRVFWIGLGNSRIFLSNDLFGHFDTPGTVEAVFDTTDAYHTYRLEAMTAGATLFIDGAPILILAGMGPNFGASPNGSIYFGDPTYWANSDTYTSSVRVSGAPCCDSTGPIARAGADQSVPEGALVTLNGSTSSTRCGTPSYTWTQLAGTAVTLDLTDPVHPTFTAPLVSIGGEVLTFQLVVADGQRSSEPYVINVTVTNINHLPVALAGDDQSVAEASPVQLNGSNSFDEDDDPQDYTWTQTAGTPVTLDLTDPIRPTFFAPFVGFAGDTLVFELSVSDTLESAIDTVSVLVENVNHDPTADAGDDRTRAEGAAVMLDASDSDDPDGDLLDYAWQQVSGPAVTLSGDDTATPSFTAPQVGAGGETLVFRVTVDDGYGGIDDDEVAITVQDTNSAPFCDLALPSVAELWPPNHKMMPVTILGVTDPDNNQIGITIVGVTQDEPIDGLGDGDTAPDAVIQGGTVLLRAERAGNRNGRVYRVTFQADDSFGGSCTGTVSVCVPHSKGRNAAPCVDDGQNYSSLGP